jgi:transcription termination factor Rho
MSKPESKSRPRRPGGRRRRPADGPSEAGVSNGRRQRRSGTSSSEGSSGQSSPQGGRRNGSSTAEGPRGQRPPSGGRRRRPSGNRPPQSGGRPAPGGRGPAGARRKRRSGGTKGQQQKLSKLFDALHRTVSIDPDERWQLSREDGSLTPRVIDLLAPIGKGQRCLLVAPPKAGKTTLLLEIARSLEVNHPEAKVFALLVDERPEEVTHFRRSCHAEVIAASSDQVAKDHVRTTERAVETVLSPVLDGEDVVLLLDSITRLARAYNTVRGDSGRTLSGGLDANAMQTPRRLFGAARNIEGGGSLTIVGTALIDTGSRMDEVIFQEFKGTGNTELVLSRQLFEKRIFPAVDIAKSGTRKEEKLYDPETIDLIHKVRRVLSSMPPDRAMEGLLKLMAKHATNEALLHALPRTP